MFEETLKGLTYFMLLFLALLLGCALAFYSEMSMYAETNGAFYSFGDSFLSTFSIVLGETDVTGIRACHVSFSPQVLTCYVWVAGDGDMFVSYSAIACFLMCAFILPIVLLNMLIAQIGDTFDRVTVLMPLLQWEGKADLVIETRALCGASGFTWLGLITTFGYMQPSVCHPPKDRKKLDTRWLHVLKPATSDGRDVSREWAGRMRHLREGVKEDITGENLKLQGAIAKLIESKIDEDRKLRAAELAAMESKMAEQQQRMERLEREVVVSRSR
jgi:hypothetical protein